MIKSALQASQWLYVSVNSKPDHPSPPGKSPGNFFERANSSPTRHKKLRNPDPWSRKIVLKPTPGVIIFKSPGNKTTKHETEIMKNLHANMVRNIVKHITAQSFLVDGFYGYSKFSNQSPFIYINKPTQEIHDKQVPKYELQEIITAKKFEPNFLMVF